MMSQFKTLKISSTLLILTYLFCNNASYAQTEWGKTGLNTLWQGIRERQPESELPKGNAPYQVPTRVNKKDIPIKLIPQADGEWIISDGWEMGEFDKVIESEQSIFSPNFDTKSWYNATVPGTVLTTLVNQGVYPEPSYGLNNMAIPTDLKYKEWWYRASFKIPAESLGKRKTLLLNGINYRAQIYLNGKKVGSMKGAFIRGEYDVTDFIKEDEENILAILVSPPYNPGIEHEQTMKAGQGLNGGQLSLDGPTFIASMGWDWIPGIRDRNMGIWQDVRLKATSDVVIGDPHVISDLPLPDTTKAELTFWVPIKNLTNKEVSGKVSVAFEKITIYKQYTLKANGEQTLVFTPKEFKGLTVKKPKLWWPNGYGKANLYDLTLGVTVGEQSSDKKQTRFGIRELSYEMMIHSEDKGNHRIAYTPVNVDNGGKPVFNFEKVKLVGNPKLQETVPTLQDSIDETKVFEQLDNNDPVGQFLVFRVNGKRIFIKGGTSGMDEMMKRVSRESLEPAFKLHRDANFNLIRNWTGENTESIFYELADEYGLLVWNDFWITTDDTVDPNDHALFVKNATDVVKRFRMHPSIAIWCPRNEGYAPVGLEHQLNAMIAKEDPTRHYHGNSRHLNSINSGPYGFIKDRSQYFTRFARGFNTEFGAQAIPTANTIKKFIAPEDQWPINDVWAYHDLHHTTHFFNDFMEAVNSYGKAEDMEDFARKAQFVTYDTWRAMIESWNSKMWNNTTGLILWMSHPAWPSMTWQTYTYDYETPGSYFGVKKGQEPVHAQLSLHDGKTMVVNNTSKDLNNMTLSVKYYGTNGNKFHEKSEKVNAKAHSKTDCFETSIKDLVAPQFTLVRVELRDNRNRIVSINDYWKNWDDINLNKEINKIPETTIDCKYKVKDNRYTIDLSNPSRNIAVGLKLNAINSNGEIVLPAYFSDGYFNLLPYERRRITLEMPENSEEVSIQVEGYNVKATVY